MQGLVHVVEEASACSRSSIENAGFPGQRSATFDTVGLCKIEGLCRKDLDLLRKVVSVNLRNRTSEHPRLVLFFEIKYRQSHQT